MFSRKRCSYALTGKDVTPTNPKSTYSYSYGDADWGDKLTAYRGQSITYDEIGNPLNDGTWTYTWQQGRQLATMSSGNITWTYTYDANGMRTSRTSNGTTAYTYVYNGSQLSMMTYNGNVLYFAYDAAGRPMTVNYNGNTYYYVTNLQGDVLAILNELGQMMVNYTYDAWGRSLGTGGALANSLGLYNPLRYRGYVYDQETGLYYLLSRYYNPQIGRFISADAYVSTGQGFAGFNMFAYCNNNPVCNYDPSGELAISLTVIGLIIGATLGAVAGGIVAHEVAEDSGAEGWELVGWTALGVIGGGIIGGAVGAGIGAAVTNATGILGLSIVKGNVFVVTKTMVLGHYGYTALGTSLGYGYYEISKALYDGMTDTQRWAMNSQFLNDCCNLGANFIVEANRVIAPYGTKLGSWLYYEIQFLLDKGYLWLEDLSALVR